MANPALRRSGSDFYYERRISTNQSLERSDGRSTLIEGWPTRFTRRSDLDAREDSNPLGLFG